MPRAKASGRIQNMKADIEKAKEAHVEANKTAAKKDATAAQKQNVQTTAQRLAELQKTFKREAFKELAGTRGTKVIKSLDSLKGLANRRTYTFDDDDVNILREAVRTSVSAAFAQFDQALQSEPADAVTVMPFNFK
jgi:hypothetical protein